MSTRTEIHTGETVPRYITRAVSHRVCRYNRLARGDRIRCAHDRHLAVHQWINNLYGAMNHHRAQIISYWQRVVAGKKHGGVRSRRRGVAALRRDTVQRLTITKAVRTAPRKSREHAARRGNDLIKYLIRKQFQFAFGISSRVRTRTYTAAAAALVRVQDGEKERGERGE